MNARYRKAYSNPRSPLVILAATVLLLFTISAWAASLDWKPFSPKDGRFRVDMPGTPELERKVEETPVGSIDTYRYELKVGKLTFAAGYADIPSLIVIFGGKERIYDKVREEYLKRAHGEEISFEEFKHDLYRGRVLVYEGDGRYGKVKMLLVSRRAYLIMASVPIDYEDKGVIDRYLASFKPIYRRARHPHESRHR